MMIAPSSIEWVASGLARVLLNEDGEAPIPAPRGQL